jgi:poly(3-hydroxybutyrate) depolymerase
VQALIVAGRFASPNEGDSITLPDGSTRTWKAVAADDKDAVRAENLAGSYAFFRVRSDEKNIMLLQASGHGMVYVNGEPRAGDPYQNGLMVVPVELKAGDNSFLFHCVRGELRATLLPVRARIMLDARDATLPDLLAERITNAPAAVLVINATTDTQDALAIKAEINGLPAGETSVPPLQPLSVRKVGIRVAADRLPAGDVPLKLTVVNYESKLPSEDELTLKLRAVSEQATRRCTFVSDIDGSVQYYALVPAKQEIDVAGGDAAPGLVLTLHGASVEAMGQAACYAPKEWCHIAAPTNRRPFGFDWEDWGRLDAMEVLDLVISELDVDPARVYLTGHSMGGHGTWHLGATYPDRFAAIGPSAGWISFWSYAGAAEYENATSIEQILRRASSSSDTLSLARNYLRQGVYILHGDADDNVPVAQAREMRKRLGEFHPDFAYREQPGAGHWWGNACVDWPPMMEFLKSHSLPQDKDVRHIEFVTANPGISATCHWAAIVQQTQALKPSAIDVTRDLEKRLVTGTTTNVECVAFDVEAFDADQPLQIELDGETISNITAPSDRRLWLTRRGGAWSAIAAPAPALKGPHRNGPFKDAFRHRMIFVYSTAGTPEENTWSMNKARYDAETFWYRGNGSVDVIADADFDHADHVNRSVILYGNAETNQAWSSLLADSPVSVVRGKVSIGTREIPGDDLACLFIRPHPHSDFACVAVVGGTGLAGMRAADRLPYFVSGVAYPDCTVIAADALERGAAGVRAAGFFGSDWSVQTGDFAWQD